MELKRHGAKLTAHGTEAEAMVRKTVVDPVTEDNGGAGGKVEPSGAEGMEGRSATGSQESHSGSKVMSDQGGDGVTREPGGMMGHGGFEGVLSQGRVDGSEDRGGVQSSVAGGGDGDPHTKAKLWTGT